MKYYLGIDGGGTKTTYTVIDEKEKVISVTRSSGTAIDTYDIKQVENLLKKSIEALPYKFSGVFAGLGGICCEADIKMVNKILAKIKNCKKAKIGSDNDVANGLRGTIDNGQGILLIVGTGAACYGVNGKIKHRTGGYGHREGDSGSAYWLGMKSINHLARVLDYRFIETSFSRALEDSMNCHKWYELVKWLAKADRAEIAKIAMTVTSYAKNKYAKTILDWGAAELKNMVDTAYEVCGFKGKAKLAIVGSLGTADTYYKSKLLEYLGNKKYNYVHDKHDAGLGAALLAKELK